MSTSLPLSILPFLASLPGLSKSFNRSRIQTVDIAVITGNLSLAAAPGNVEITPRESGLRKTSVVNVSQLFTVDKQALRSRSGRLTLSSMEAVSEGYVRCLSYEEARAA